MDTEDLSDGSDSDDGEDYQPSFSKRKSKANIKVKVTTKSKSRPEVKEGNGRGGSSKSKSNNESGQEGSDSDSEAGVEVADDEDRDGDDNNEDVVEEEEEPETEYSSDSDDEDNDNNEGPSRSTRSGSGKERMTANRSSSQADEEEEEDDTERIERLWQEFLTPPKEKEKPEEKKVETKKSPVKDYEFAGEKVASAETGDKSRLGKNNDNAGIGGPEASTSTTSPIVGSGNRPTLKRGGVSFLSGDPESIGLSGPASKGGLSNVLAALRNAKRQKIGTLEKSKMDWEAFKRDAGITEELQSHIKNKDGYMERQEFLQRSDLRQFEIEKNIRNKTRRGPGRPPGS